MQTPGSILLQLDSSTRTAERIKVARQLADDLDAECDEHHFSVHDATGTDVALSVSRLYSVRQK